MSLRVDATALGALPAQLDRLQVDANKGQLYVSDHTNLSYGGVLNKLTGSHQGVVERVRDFMDRLANPVAGNTAQAVRAAISYYQTTDEAAAARLDANYPRIDPAAMDGTGATSGWSVGFTDVAEPEDHYQDPPDRSAEFAYEPTPLILISPAAFGRTVIVEATTLASHLGLGHPWDPYAAILQPLTGDWNGLRACADVFDNLAGAVTDMAANVRNGAGSVHSVWEGNAADGVLAHLLRLATALAEATEPLEQLGKAYEQAAEGAHELFKALGDVLNDLIDAVLIFIAEASAAAATSETGVGAIIFIGAAAFDARWIYQLVREAIDLFTTASAVVETLMSAQHGFGVVDSHITLPELDETRPPLPGDQASVGRPTIRQAPGPSFRQAVPS